MQNYNQQQQAVILKGIAQQILQMNVPSFAVVMNLFNEFEYQLVSQETITGFEKKIDSLERVQEIHMKSIRSLQTALDESRTKDGEHSNYELNLVNMILNKHGIIHDNSAEGIISYIDALWAEHNK